MNDMAKIEARAERISARKALAIFTETFSESFSKGVSNGSSEQCRIYLNLLKKLRIFTPKNGHGSSNPGHWLHFLTD
jgi:hypothetical protein